MRKRFLILSIIGLMLVGLLGTTYAYYTIHIDDTKESISTSTANFGSLTAEGESLSLISPNPSDSMSETTYKVISSSDTTEDRSYTLSLQIDQNTFVNTVEGLQGNSTTQNGQLVIEVTLPSNVETFTFYEDAPDFITFNSSTNVITIDVTDSTTAAADTYQLLKGVIIEAADTQEYDVTFQFKNLSDYNQSDNMGKKFRGGLIIEADKKPDIIPGYTEVAYLESNGTQYINTGIYPNLDTFMLSTKVYIVPNNISYSSILGSQHTTGITLVRVGTSDNYMFEFDGTTNRSYTPVQNEWLTVEINLTNNFASHGTTSFNDLNSSQVSPTTFLLFAKWLNNSSSIDHYSACKIKEVKLGNGNYTNDMFPCIRKTDSKPGMCDTVTKTYFTNQGTGEFGYETLDGTYIAPQ